MEVLTVLLIRTCFVMHNMLPTCNTVSTIAEDTKSGIWHMTPCILKTDRVTSHYKTLQSPLLYFGILSLVGCDAV